MSETPFPKYGDNFETVGRVAEPDQLSGMILAMVISSDDGFSTHGLAVELGKPPANVARVCEALRVAGVLELSSPKTFARWVLGNRPALSLAMRLGRVEIGRRVTA